MSIQREDYNHFGFSLRAPQARTFVSAMADTGCQSCLAGLKVIKKFSLSTQDLIAVGIEMHAANNNVCVLGATILRFSGRNKNGEEQFTRQIVYITDNMDKLFLSRETCVDLGIIPKTFPAIGEAVSTQSTNSIGATDTAPLPLENQCPRQTKLPPIPSYLPFSATEANRGKLQQYLLDLLCLQYIQHVNIRHFH